MKKCDNPNCTGHLGKFSSCLDEVVYLDTMDGTGEITGSVDFHGAFVLISYESDEIRTINASPPVMVPKGTYLVIEDERGFVGVTRFETYEEARIIFDAADAEYSVWLGDSDNPLNCQLNGPNCRGCGGCEN